MVKLLEKDPACRPQSASEVAQALSALAARTQTGLRPLLRPKYSIPIFVIILVTTAAVLWLYRRVDRQHWVREHAIPEIARLAPTQPLAAFLLLRQAEGMQPGDAQLSRIAQSFTRSVSVDSKPTGAKVEIQDYVKPGAWFPLGATPPGTYASRMATSAGGSPRSAPDNS